MEYLDTTEDILSDVPEEDAAEGCAVEQPDDSFINLDCEILTNLPGRDKAAAVRRGLVKRQKPSLNFLKQSVLVLPTDDHGSVSSDDSSDDDKHRSPAEPVHKPEEPNLKANSETAMAHGQSVGETLVPPRVKVFAGLDPAAASVAAAAAAIARSSSLRGRLPTQSPALVSDLRGSPALIRARETRGADSEDEEKEEMKKKAERDEDSGHVSRAPASNAARHPAGGKLPPLFPNKPVTSMHWKLPAADGPPDGSSGVCATTAEESIPEVDRDRPPLPPAKPPRLKAVASDDAHSLPHPRSPPPRPAKPRAVLPNPSQQQQLAAQGSVDSAARERLPGDVRGPYRPAAAAASTGAASPAVVSADAAVAGTAAASAEAARTACLETRISLSQPTTADQPFSERNPFVERDLTTAVAAPARPKKPERLDAQAANDRNPERQHEHQSWRQYDHSARPAAIVAKSISFGTSAIEHRTESSSDEQEPMYERHDSDGGDTGRLAVGAAASAAAHRKRAAPVDLATPPSGSLAASRQCLDEPATKRQQQTSEASKELAIGGKVDCVTLGSNSLEQDEPVRATDARRLGTVQASECSDSRLLSTELHFRATDVDDRQLHTTTAVKGSTRFAESGRAVFEGVAKQHEADPAIKRGGAEPFHGTGQQQLPYQQEQKQREAGEVRSDSTRKLTDVPTASADRKNDAAAVGGSGASAIGVALKSSSDHRGYRGSASVAHAVLPASGTREVGSVHAAREPGSAATATGAPQTGSSEKPIAGQQPFGKVPPVPRPRPPQKPALLIPLQTPLQTASVGRGTNAADQATFAVTATTSSSGVGASHLVKSSTKAIGVSRTSEPRAALPPATAAAAAASAPSSTSDNFDDAAGKSVLSPDDSNALPSAGSGIGSIGGGLTDSRAAESSAMRAHAGGDRAARGSSGPTTSAHSSEHAAVPTVQLKHLPLKEERKREEEEQQQMPSVRLRRKSPPALPAFSSAGDGAEAAALSPSSQRSSLPQRRHTHAAYDSTPLRGGANAAQPAATAAPAQPAWMRIAAEKAKRNSQLVDNDAHEVAGSTRKAVPPTAEQDSASSRAAADPGVVAGWSSSKGADSNCCPPLGGNAAAQPLTSGPGGGSGRSTGGASAVALPSAAQQSSRATGAAATQRAGAGRVHGDGGRDVASVRVQQHRSTKDADMPSRTTSVPQNDENQPPLQTVAGNPSDSAAKGTDGPLVIGRAQPLLPLTSKPSSSPESQPSGARRHSSDSPASATNGTHTTSPRILPPDAGATTVTGTLAAPVDGQADVTLRVGRPARLQPDKRVHSVIVTGSGGPSSPGRIGVEETALNSPRARAGSGPKDAGDFGSQEPEFMKFFKARQSRLRASSIHTFDD